ncbi:MAG: hypothetical protein E7047_02240 [Lentisphaerae bacterium]|nr:hypothetical protein [Lentisphaerota bacterium]
MQLAKFAQYYDLTEEAREFVVKFDFNQVAATLENIPESLQEDFIRQQLAKLRKPLDEQQILQCARELKSNRLLLAGYNFLCYYWWQHPAALLYNYKLPLFENTPDGADHAGVYYLLAALAGFPAIEKSYARLQLPPSYALDAMQYTSGAVFEYAAGHDGKLGINNTKLHWYRFYVDGVLFRIGRFEYMLQDPLPYLPAAFKRNSDGKVIALCRHGWHLRKDGLRLFTDETPNQACKTTILHNDGASITGTPIDPAGYAEVDRTLTLDLQQYTPLWNCWDLVPGLHIPGGGGMTPEAAADSLQKALEFFPRYFGRKVAAVSCYSWIFNNDFEKLLPESNLADFMRQVYLFPFPSVGVEGLAFVFGKNKADWENFPEDNSLRRAFHQLHEQNWRLKAGGMFITPEAIKNYGQNLYRRDYQSFAKL